MYRFQFSGTRLLSLHAVIMASSANSRANQASSSGTGSSVATNGMTLVKKNTKSNVWLHFGLRARDIVEQEQHHSICRKCGVSVRATNGNTSNLHQHLRDHHPDLYTALSTCTSTSSRSRPHGHGGGESSCKTQSTIAESVLQSTKYA